MDRVWNSDLFSQRSKKHNGINLKCYEIARLWTSGVNLKVKDQLVMETTKLGTNGTIFPKIERGARLLVKVNKK